MEISVRGKNHGKSLQDAIVCVSHLFLEAHNFLGTLLSTHVIRRTNMFSIETPVFPPSRYNRCRSALLLVSQDSARASCVKSMHINPTSDKGSCEVLRL